MSKQSAMDEMLRVLVAEADANTREALCSALAGQGLVVDIAKDGRQALTLAEALLPDVLVLAIALPVRDGLGVLETLSQRSLSRYPHILVLTALPQWVSEEALRTGADAALAKPADARAVSAALRELAASGPSALALSHARRRLPLALRQLQEIGMPEGLKGFAYLTQAVALVSVDDRMLRHATGRLYPWVARDFGVSSPSVERAIRHAIETTWTRGRVEALHQVFGNSIDPQRGKPMNTECIAMLAEKLVKSARAEA